jgi:precorrin-3B C17-methyltransferase
LSRGKVYALSIGHTRSQITPEAQAALRGVDVVAGHSGFIEIARPFLNEAAQIIDDRVTMAAADTPEAAKQSRVAAVVAQALLGKSVAILSGGDTGIWGYAGFFFEAQQYHNGAFDVEAIPGVAGMVASAARVGAPLMNGFALIALGDEDMPFTAVERRLKGAALGGFAIVLYKLILESAGSPAFYPPDRYPELHPPLVRTKERLERAYALLSEHIAPATPMAIITDVYDQSSNYSGRSPLLGSDSGQEEIILTTFDQFLRYSDRYRFLTTVIIGEEMTRVWRDKMYTAQWNRRWAYDDRVLQRVAQLEYLVKAKEFFRNGAKSAPSP